MNRFIIDNLIQYSFQINITFRYFILLQTIWDFIPERLLTEKIYEKFHVF